MQKRSLAKTSKRQTRRMRRTSVAVSSALRRSAAERRAIPRSCRRNAGGFRRPPPQATTCQASWAQAAPHGPPGGFRCKAKQQSPPRFRGRGMAWAIHFCHRPTSESEDRCARAIRNRRPPTLASTHDAIANAEQATAGYRRQRRLPREASDDSESREMALAMRRSATPSAARPIPIAGAGEVGSQIEQAGSSVLHCPDS